MNRADAPQSSDEVSAVVQELRLLDPRLDLRWNPTAFVERYGGYDALGQSTGPVYAARWEVICYESAASTAAWRVAGERPYQRVLLVTAPVPASDQIRGVPALTTRGPYAPVGPWLVAHMRAIDQAAARTLTEMRAQLDAADAAEAASAARTEDDGIAESAGRVWDDAHRAQGVAVFHPVAIDLTRGPAALTR